MGNGLREIHKKIIVEKAVKLFEEYEIKRTPAEWSFRWLWSQKEVTCVLSGMNSEKMVEANCKAASTSKVGEYTEKDQELLKQVVAAINEKMKVGCTGCGYCMPCPKNVDIPGTFSAYNKRYTDGWFTGMKEYVMCTLLRKDATSVSNCIECGKCEGHCPQKIEIRKFKSIWGNCNSNRVIKMNQNLAHYGIEQIEYVCLHELTHLKHMNHSKEYWQLVSTIFPNYKEKRNYE